MPSKNGRLNQSVTTAAHRLTPEIVETVLLLSNGHSASSVGDLLGFTDPRTTINRVEKLAEITGGVVVEYSKTSKRWSLTEHGERIRGELMQFLSLAQKLSDRSKSQVAVLHLPQHTGFVAPALDKLSPGNDVEEIRARVLGEEGRERNSFIVRAVHQLFSGKYDLIIGHEVNLQEARKEGNETTHIRARHLYDSFLTALIKKEHTHGRQVVYLSDLEGERLLVSPEGTRSRALLNSLSNAEAVAINPFRQTYESKVLVSLAHKDVGIPILSSDAAAQFDAEVDGEFAGKWLSDYRWLPIASQTGDIRSAPVYATWRIDKNVKLISQMVELLYENSDYLRSRHDAAMTSATAEKTHQK